jgi:putative ABC transport system permease protein
MCAAVLLTSGRTVGAEERVIASIDSAGTRAIAVRAERAAGLDTSVLDRIRHLDGIEWAVAFSPAQDVYNTAFPGGTPTPIRLAFGDSWTPFGLSGDLPTGGDIAYASSPALASLGLDEPIGQVQVRDGSVGWAVGGRVVVPDYLAFLQPVLIAPQALDGPSEPVGTLVVVADRPDLVAALADAIRSVLAADDPTKITIQTSEALATLRALVEGQLGTFGRGLTLGILGLTALLVATLVYGMVLLRRKDFGRRRALGASQRFIVLLLTIQTAILATLGAAVGTAAAVVALIAIGDPLPGFAYVMGVVALAILVAIIAALLPAVAAARREPIRELRVP